MRDKYDETIDKAYEWADKIRACLGIKPRKTYARGTTDHCPLEVHLGSGDLVGVAHDGAYINQSHKDYEKIVARLDEAGVEYRKRQWPTRGVVVTATLEVREFVQRADGEVATDLPRELQGKWGV